MNARQRLCRTGRVPAQIIQTRTGAITEHFSGRYGLMETGNEDAVVRYEGGSLYFWQFSRKETN
jgi:hypothetical protein